MRCKSYVVLIYGVLLMIGGIIGYAKVGSLVSLLAGGSAGIIAIGSAIAMRREMAAAVWCAIILSLALTGFFAYRFVKTGQIFPAGMMTILSLFVLISLSVRRSCSPCENKKK